MTTKENNLIEQLEQELDSFDPSERKQALNALCEQVQAGKISLPESTTEVNLHCHTFFSFNAYGYSPSKFAWLARKAGLAVAGVVDFDVLDALEEFLEAAKMLGLKACAGMETRVFVPEFSDKVINSPGEPGISYHMGVGFPSAQLEDTQQKFLSDLKQTAQQRNKDLTDRVNKYLGPVMLDYEKEVLPLSPSGNAIERHICLAYARKAAETFSRISALDKFWSEKLDAEAAQLGLPEGRDLLNTIRSKTMKRGGVGYVQPGEGSFPFMADTNRFILASGGIPTHTWLNGISNGEKDIEGLLKVAMSSGAAAINIIPDRNYTVGTKDEKLKNLYEVVELAEKLDLVVVIGTEMNSPGQKFVDDFNSAELAPLTAVFLKGAYIVYAHSIMQQKCRMGYTSGWAKNNFKNVAKKNEFFRKLGSLIDPADEDELACVTEDMTAQQILEKISNE